MTSLSFRKLKQQLKQSQSPSVKKTLCFIKAIICFDFPAPKWVFRPIYHLYTAVSNVLGGLLRVLFWSPLFKGVINKCGKRLYLYGGLPFISGGLEINIGDDCRISGATTLTGRVHGNHAAQLTVGNNVDIGWMTTIASGNKVILGDNVRIAGRSFFAGYPGHPINAKDRALGLPDTQEQIGDIIIKNDCWLATGVSVMAGVTIGSGTIVAAGSVVTHDLPSNVLAAGVPAKVIKHLA